MESTSYPVTQEVMNQVQRYTSELDKILDDHPKLITAINDNYVYEISRNESRETQLAFENIISDQIINDPFYEFFVSIEIIENGETSRILEDIRGGWSSLDVTDKNIRRKSSNRPIPDATLENIYGIIVFFLNRITMNGEAKVYAEIVSRANYQARGVIDYNPVYKAYLYRTY